MPVSEASVLYHPEPENIPTITSSEGLRSINWTELEFWNRMQAKEMYRFANYIPNTGGSDKFKTCQHVNQPLIVLKVTFHCVGQLPKSGMLLR